MRAVQLNRLEGPESVEVVEISDPRPRDDQLVVEVHAAGVNFPDVLMTKGEYQLKPELPFVLGSEIAGVVRSAPSSSTLSTGDRVAGFSGLGAFADLVVADERSLFKLPDGVSFNVGAAVPMNYLTVHFGLKRRGRLQAGETVLVHGAAGGIGTAGIQVAKALGARVIGVVSSEEKAAVALAAGADEAIAVEGFKDAAKELTGGKGVDVVLDPVGGDRFTDSLRSLAVEGRLLVIGFTAGEIPTVRVNRLLLNNIEVVGVGWGAFWMGQPTFLAKQWEEIVPMLVDGRLDPPIGATFALEQAANALNELGERRARGKVLLLPANVQMAPTR